MSPVAEIPPQGPPAPVHMGVKQTPLLPPFQGETGLLEEADRQTRLLVRLRKYGSTGLL